MTRRLWLRYCICFLALLPSMPGWAQSSAPEKEEVFRDTLFGLFAFDSLQHNFGDFWPELNIMVVKKFKYLGKEPAFIRKTWYQGPHFFCSYPRELLEPNKTYELRFCLNHKAKETSHTRFYGILGLHLSNGERVTFKFRGKYVPPPNSQLTDEEKGLDTLKD